KFFCCIYVHIIDSHVCMSASDGTCLGTFKTEKWGKATPRRRRTFLKLTVRDAMYVYKNAVEYSSQFTTESRKFCGHCKKENKRVQVQPEHTYVFGYMHVGMYIYVCIEY